MTPSQASMCAARARELYEQQAKERQKRKPADFVVANLPPQNEGHKARDAAGKAFGVSGKSVDFAKKVLDKGIPELAKAGDTSFSLKCAKSGKTQNETLTRSV